MKLYDETKSKMELYNQIELSSQVIVMVGYSIFQCSRAGWIGA